MVVGNQTHTQHQPPQRSKTVGDTHLTHSALLLRLIKSVAAWKHHITLNQNEFPENLLSDIFNHNEKKKLNETKCTCNLSNDDDDD